MAKSKRSVYRVPLISTESPTALETRFFWGDRGDSSRFFFAPLLTFQAKLSKSLSAVTSHALVLQRYGRRPEQDFRESVAASVPTSPVHKRGAGHNEQTPRMLLVCLLLGLR